MQTYDVRVHAQNCSRTNNNHARPSARPQTNIYTRSHPSAVKPFSSTSTW